jgi:site-specific recombinase XerC
MMHTGRTLEAVLDRRKEHLRTPYMDFDDNSEHIPPHITDALNELCKNSTDYLFETASGKRIRRTQVMRNLKQAGHNIGLDFDLTPKVLHGYVCAYMSKDKRSELEKALGFSIN